MQLIKIYNLRSTTYNYDRHHRHKTMTIQELGYQQSLSQRSTNIYEKKNFFKKD